MAYRYTTQKDLRKQFWLDNPSVSRRKITDYTGKGKMYTTDTRCAFGDWVDALETNGDISNTLANRVTLLGG